MLRKFYKVGAVNLALLIALLAVFAIYVKHDVNADATCEDVLVVFARGSGQPQGESGDDLRQKPERVKFFDEIQSRAPANIEIEFRELSYPAVDWPHFLSAELSWLEAIGWGRYMASVITGERNLTGLILNEISTCPDQQIVLGGYSQGAQVVGNVLYGLGDIPASKIAFVALFGDTKFDPSSFAARGTFTRVNGGILEPREEDFPSRFNSTINEPGVKVMSWCRSNDGICETAISRLVGPFSEHTSYPNREIPQAANEAAIRLQQHYPGFKTANILGDDELATDVMLVVDATRNFRIGYFNILDNLRPIFDEVQQDYNGNLRVGFTQYKDFIPSIGDAGTAVSNLTNDPDELMDSISRHAWNSGGGGGTEEAVYSGIVKGLGQAWRVSADKRLILIPYSMPHDPEDWSGFTQESVITEAINRNVRVHVGIDTFTFLNYEHIVAKYENLANGTRGRIFSGFRDPRPSDVLPFVLNSFKSEPRLPEITQMRGQPGQEVTISVGGLFDPDSSIERYEWDFDNDGTIDTTTTTAVAKHTYNTDYSGLIAVRVFSKDGDEKVLYVSAEIDESIEIIEPPSEPENVKVDISLDAPDPIREAMVPLAVAGIAQTEPTYTATLSWDPPVDDGGAPIEGYLIRGNGEILGFVGAATTQAVINDVPEDATFSVEAVNEAGNSDSQPAEEIESHDEEDQKVLPNDPAVDGPSHEADSNSSEPTGPSPNGTARSNEKTVSANSTDQSNIHQLTATADAGREAASMFATATSRAPWMYGLVAIAVISLSSYAYLGKHSRSQ